MGKKIFKWVLAILTKPTVWFFILTILSSAGFDWSDKDSSLVSTIGMVLADIGKTLLGR